MVATIQTIDNLFAAPPCDHLPQTESKDTKQAFPTITENADHTNALDGTPDNTIPEDQKYTPDNPLQNTKQKPESEKPKNPENSENSNGTPIPNLDSALNIVQQVQANAEVIKQNPLITDVKTDELAYSTGQTLKPAENIALPAISADTIESKTTQFNTAEQPVTADLQLNKENSSGTTHAVKTTLFAAEDSNIQQSNEVLIPKAPIETDGKIIPSAKTTEKTSTETTSESQQTPSLRIDTSLVQSNQSQIPNKTPLSPETSNSSAEKPASNEFASLEQSRPDIQEFSQSFDSNDKNQKHSSSDSSATLKATVTELTNEQGKNQSLKPDNTSNQISDRPIPPNNIQNNTSSESANFTETAKSPNDTPLKETVDGISRQITESIQSSLNQPAGKQQITVQLNPPELGRVQIKFNQEQDQLTGQLEIDKAQTKSDIEQSLPQIIRNLSDAGIQLKKLEVTLTDQNNQQLIKDQSPNYESFQQHHFAGNEDTANAGIAETNEWPLSDVIYEDNPETQGQITNSSINVLV